MYAGAQLGPWALEHAVRTARTRVPGLPQGFRYHDLRHYFASLLIASGSEVKAVQARVRHASAKTTLDCQLRGGLREYRAPDGPEDQPVRQPGELHPPV